MKLVFITQVLDRRDAVLGFVPRWVEGLARECAAVRVLALELGDVSGLPANVDWREIGRTGVVLRYLRFRKFLNEALAREGFDAVLAHMVPRYAILAARAARKHGAGLHLWYTHGAVDDRLRRALELCDRAFTATPESLRIESLKVVVTGHGIDLAHFDARGERAAEPRRVLSVGRLTPAKDPLTILAALAKVRARGFDVALDLVGGALARGDEEYGRAVERRIDELALRGAVELHGAVAYRDIAPLYRRASVVVNASSTGSLDKVVLEAFAASRPVLSSNESFPALVAELGDDARALEFPRGDADALALRLQALLSRSPADLELLAARLRSIVARDHEVDRLMARLVREMSQVQVRR